MKTKKIKKIGQKNQTPDLTGANDPLETLLRFYIDEFVQKNAAAHTVAAGLRVIGIGFRPIIDHITFRTSNVESRAKEFEAYGYKYDAKLGTIKYDNWWAKVYRKTGYPTIFIDQAYGGKRGKKSLIPGWVEDFGDKTLHHIAIQVDDIEQAIFFLEKQGVHFAGHTVGDRGTDLRQIFTAPQIAKGKAFSVLELTERHRGYCGFLPPQADGLMESTRMK